MKSRFLKIPIALLIPFLPGMFGEIPAGLNSHVKGLVPGFRGSISLGPVNASLIGWKVYPDKVPAYLVSLVPADGKQVMRALFLVGRKGRFYHEFYPPAGGDMTGGEIERRIAGLEKLLALNVFPSPEHRYGAEAELANLRNRAGPRSFSAGFICASGDYLVFSGPDYGKSETAVKCPGTGTQGKPITDSSGMPVSYEGMGHGYHTGEDAVTISPLPYAYIRDYAKEIFRQHPGIRTVILKSIDAHSMGKSGIQIDNR